MSLIPCTTDCFYQENGYCNLDHTAGGGIPSDSGCIHYIPKKSVPFKSELEKHGREGVM